jgi:hypothetical protein
MCQLSASAELKATISFSIFLGIEFAYTILNWLSMNPNSEKISVDN